MKQPQDTPVLTVSQITRKIKNLLEGEFVDVWVSGEISNYLRHSSGHHYFTIKDDKAEMPCTLWRGTAAGIKLQLRDGLKVILYGDVNVYELRGRYQLNVKWIVEEGIGQLEVKLRELKERLQKEGLFDERYKKPIPVFPRSVGIITSPTGAAVRDMISVIRRRMPSCRIILCPVAVQGPGAENEIANGIRLFNRYGEVDLLIVGRGGGSLEDLWAFNEEVVARAIFESEIPIISAVGHEIDFTISDFVADLRAPTPSAAAELAVPDSREIAGRIAGLGDQLHMAILKTLDSMRHRLKSAGTSYLLRRPEELLRGPAQTVDELYSRLVKAANLKIERYQNRLKIADEKLAALSPREVLRRGYAVCRTVPDMGVVRSIDQVKIGGEIRVELAEGAILGEVRKTAKE
ncbi:MAG: exodeoxyribonuclease VII large subunit [candidate division Zixibacteria bacterium]|nr:exodeoxyribonuclease VII large subunit [candidate division Zixibacteria bacterium]MBU1471795.1 exodeoxyribonuclease VII large subunit [candidate division Zixibacteria bacterium]MBU2626150.1 exodeoxyribonuclease VII large subunit [candidate division Zixibacteria bacterium]